MASDGCAPNCDVEPGYTCTGETSVCQSACGNGTIDTGEECDDGNTMAGDRCSATCTLEYDLAEVEPNNTTAQTVTASNHLIRGAIDPAGDVRPLHVHADRTRDGLALCRGYADALRRP